MEELADAGDNDDDEVEEVVAVGEDEENVEQVMENVRMDLPKSEYGEITR